MFHTEKPGKYVIDVCTNLSCALRGAEGMLTYLETEAGHQGRHQRRQVLPARDRVPGRRAAPRPACRSTRTTTRASPRRRWTQIAGEALDERRSMEKVITRELGQARPGHPRRATRQHGGYQALKKALEMRAGGGHRRGEEVEPARPRRRGLPHRHEVELRAAKDSPKPKYLAVNADESRAGHREGPLHPRERPAHAARGHRHRLLGAGRAHLLHLLARRVQVPVAGARQAPSTRPTPPASSARS